MILLVVDLQFFQGSMCVGTHFAPVRPVTLPLCFTLVIPFTDVFDVLYVVGKVLGGDLHQRVPLLVMSEDPMDSRVHIRTMAAFVDGTGVDVSLLSKVGGFHLHSGVFLPIVSQQPVEAVVLGQTHRALVRVVRDAGETRVGLVLVLMKVLRRCADIQRPVFLKRLINKSGCVSLGDWLGLFVG